jgi:hypothetical protein
MGGNDAKKEKKGIMQYVDEIRKHMEEQDDFGGWEKFAKTWDVDEKSPLVALKRTSSIQTEWNKALREEAKGLPLAEALEAPTSKKLLQNKLRNKVQTKKQELAGKSAVPTRDSSGRFIGKKQSFWET